MSLENLKLITNYKESKLDSTSVNLFYVELVDENDDKYIRELKTKRREVAIDVVLGEKEESELDEIKIHQQINSVDNTFGTILAPSVHSVSSKVKSYADYNQIYDDLLQFIDKETNLQKNIPGVGSNIDLVFKKDINLTDYENYEAFCRKIMSRLTMCSNIISMEGRIGLGTFVLVGKDNWYYFERIEDVNINPLGLKIIYTDKIQGDKVIVSRSNNPDQSGISLFMDLENKKYSRFETNLWKKQYCWFKIT